MVDLWVVLMLGGYEDGAAAAVLVFRWSRFGGGTRSAFGFGGGGGDGSGFVSVVVTNMVLFWW
jgi:hypothetical protein